MRIKLYQVDAFTHRLFGGNPAAVCPLESWLSDDVLRAISAENNLSETAFFVPDGEGWHLRWFTPEVEVDLCGHGTLATAHVLFEVLGDERDALVFRTRSGPLTVTRAGERLAMDFPATAPQRAESPAGLEAALGVEAAEILATAHHDVVVVRDEEAVASCRPDFGALRRLGRGYVMITAPGDASGVDFVSRFFAPLKGIDEDPVTGSAHCVLAPYWARRLGKPELRARQRSRRGGELACRVRGDRVELAGRAVLYLEGEITL